MALEGGPEQRVAVAGVVVNAECLLEPGWHEHHAAEDPHLQLPVAAEGRDFVEWAAGAFGAGRVAVVSTMFPSEQIRRSLTDAANEDGKARTLWEGRFSGNVIGTEYLGQLNPDRQFWNGLAFRVAAARIALKPTSLAAVDSSRVRLAAADDFGFGLCFGVGLPKGLLGITHQATSLAVAQRELIEFTGK